MSKDPVSGRGNLSYNRMLVLGPQTFGFNVNEWRHVRMFMESREEAMRPFPAAVATGWYEHVYIGNVLPREPLLRRFVRHINTGATVHIPPYANGFTAIIRFKRDNPGQPKNLAMAAMAAHVNVRNVIVVDEDVDIYDPADVLWAISNRVDWRLDTFTVPFAMGHEMDPTADNRGISTKLGIDATYKRERREYGERVQYGQVDVRQFLDE